MKTNSLSEKQNHKKDWERDGFLIFPKVLSPDECGQLKEKGLQVLETHAKPGATVYVGCAVASPDFARLAEHPTIVNILRQLMPDGIEFLSDKLVYKKPGKSFATPWHVDAWYWKGTRPKLSVWIPFADTCADGGTLTVLPGSHRCEWSVQKTKRVDGGEFSEFIDETELNGQDIRVCEIEAGTAIIFSDRLLHGSTASQGTRERYAIISTYHAPGNEPFDQNFLARKVIT